MRRKLTLIISERMDNNRKRDRAENNLVRMSAVARDYMKLHDDHVELWPVGSVGEEKLNKSLSLKIFHAFSSDIQKVDEEQRKYVGFVTTETFNKICGGDKTSTNNIWISDDILNTVMGTDPEFLVFKNGAVINATDILPYAGEMGSDGAMAEIRPQPEVSIDKLVKNMKRIFEVNLNKDNLNGCELIATCYHEDANRGYPVGGHIHVGNPVQLVNKSSTTREKFYRVLNKIMDEYLTVPLIKLDGPDGAKRRDTKKPGSGYGYFGDYRTEHGRLEHRSLSGIWLLHMSLSRAVLGTAKAVTDEAFRLIAEHRFEEEYILPNKFSDVNLYNSNFSSWDKVPLAADMKCIEPSRWMRGALNVSDNDLINRTYINKLYNKLRQLSTYEDNRKYIDGFCEILRVNYKEFSNWDRNIKNNWLSDRKFLVDI